MPTQSATALQTNHEFVLDFVNPGSSVLDLGCGDGRLLATLRAERNASVQGVEMDLTKIQDCASRDVPVVQANLDEGLGCFATAQFDVVVLSQTLQEVQNPAVVMREMLRVGRRSLVIFPNFGHFSLRWHLLTRGTMPITPALPHSWHDTPNIHHLTLNDFHQFARSLGAQVERVVAYRNQRAITFLPNLRADTVLAVLSPSSSTSSPA